MGKRFWSLVLSSALIAGVFTALPAVSASAQEAMPMACGELFTDPAADVDFENLDVLNGGIAANDDSSFTAELRVKNLSTDLPPDAQGLTWYFLWKYGDVTYFANATYSMWTDAITYNLGTLGAQFTTTASTEGTFTEGENGVITVVVPYAEVGAPTSGAVLADTYADTRVRLGGPAGPGIVSAIDRAPDGTSFGTSYTLGSCGSGGPVVAEPTPEPPGKADPPGKGKKNGCKKGKGKKKGACPGKKPPKPKPAVSCPAYVPGEQGAAAPTSIVTAAATEDKPVEVTIAAPAGDPTTVPATFQNIQVDAAAADAGLYVRYEFPIEEDHDIYLNYADGSEAAHAGGFNPFPFVPANDVFSTDGTGNGGHSEQGAEVLDGIRTADCGGYTLQMDSFLSAGGDMTLKLWLGEPQYDPAAPAGALETFMSLLGL